MKRETTILIIAMVVLMSTGLLMVYSVGALRNPEAMLYIKHLVYLCVGFTGFLVMSRFDYHYLGAPFMLRYIVLGTLFLLALTFVPGFRLTMGGASRWIGWRFISFQPSELAKFALVLLLAVRLTQYQDKIKGLATGFIMPFSIAGVFVAIVVAQKDLGIPMVMLATTFIMVWVAGARKLYLIGSAASGRHYPADYVFRLSYGPYARLSGPLERPRKYGLSIDSVPVRLRTGRLLGARRRRGRTKTGLPACGAHGFCLCRNRRGIRICGHNADARIFCADYLCGL